MNSVTSKFNKYDLSEICAEFTSWLDPNQSVPPLPKYVGGSDAHLLLGVKNTNLDPFWIKTLPSGVAVYRSVFRDIWGSNLIFAGPHKTFTSVNKACIINHSIFGTHPAARNDERGGDLLMDERGSGMVIDTELGVTVTPMSGKLEQGMRVGCVDDILYYNYRFMGKFQFKFADIDVIPFLEIHEITKNLGSEILTANITRLGKPNFRSLGRDGMQIDLSPDAVQILEDDRLAYNYCYQVYIDNVFRLLARPSKWEKSGRLRQINYVILFTIRDSGYSKKAVIWKLGRVVAAFNRSTSISYAANPRVPVPPL